MLILFAGGSNYEGYSDAPTLTTTFPDTAAGRASKAQAEAAIATQAASPDQELALAYPYFQDVHIMMFIGFAFLMTFLSRYSWSAVGFNFLICVMTIQWNTLTHHFWKTVITGASFSDVRVGISDLITGDFAAAAVLIAFGSVLGRTSPLQTAVMAFLLNLIFTLNEVILVEEIKAIDIGGSMVVHAFGALFGLACSFVLSQDKDAKGGATSSRTNALFSMIGTIFLFAFWPSFNGAFAVGASQHRVIVNTVFSLCGSAVSAFLFSYALRGGRFEMEDIQNATLAGGVAVGTSANLVLFPGTALAIGLVAGFVSVVGYVHLTPLCTRRCNIRDTAGVNNLHGIPGILAGIISAVAIGGSSNDTYGLALATVLPNVANGELSFSDQAGRQLAALVTSVVIALVGGLLTGAVLRIPICSRPLSLYDDRESWHLSDLDMFPNEIGAVDEEHGVTKDVYVGRTATATADTTAMPTAPLTSAADADADDGSESDDSIGHKGGWARTAASPRTGEDEADTKEPTA